MNNFVAKHARTYNKAQVHVDRKKQRNQNARGNVDYNHMYDCTDDYRGILPEISSHTEIPIHNIRILESVCGEDCIYDTRNNQWCGYVSEYL